MKINSFFNKKTISVFAAMTIIALFLPIFVLFLSPSVQSEEKDQENFIKLPVIMYHSVVKKPKQQNNFIISEEIFESDLNYLQEHGFKCILVKDLINYVYNNKPLPEKPIMLTFDDGAFNNYSCAFPLAKKYGAKFIFSPIGKEADKYSKLNEENSSYSHANWNRIKEMSDSGIVEIQNHTYDMHKPKGLRIGCKKKRSESLDEYRINLINDLNKAQKAIEKATNFIPSAFFYPFGAYSKCSDKILKEMGFKATFLCESKINYITKNPDSLYGLKRFLRPPKTSPHKFFEKIFK